MQIIWKRIRKAGRKVEGSFNEVQFKKELNEKKNNNDKHIPEKVEIVRQDKKIHERRQ